MRETIRSTRRPSRPVAPRCARAPALLLELVVAAGLSLAASEIGASPVRVAGDEVVLEAAGAEFTGELRWQAEERTLGSWKSIEDEVSWWVEAEAAGPWDVGLVYSCPSADRGSVVEIVCGTSSVRAEIHPTGSPPRILTLPAGLLDLPQGVSRITLRALSKGSPSGEVLTLRGLVLESGFRSLFNGRDLSGWDTRFFAGTGYVVSDGTIVCNKDGGGNLYTEEEYADFCLRFEFRLERCGNNGLGIRARKGTPPERLDAAYHGLEVQILDDECPGYKDKIQPWQYHGSVYGVLPARRGFLRPAGEWNVEEVIARGPRMTVKLNGSVIVDGTLEGAASHLKNHIGMRNERGFIGFLGHGSRVEFRGIRLRDLAPKE